MNAERPPRTDDDSADGDADAPDRVRVGVAEFAVARGDTLLASSGFGSCVAVAVADPTAAVAGLAHVMVPSTDADADAAKPAKAAPDGVRRLLAAVETAGADPERVEAKLAGGSRMLDFSGVGEGVGRRNVEAARESLADRDVPVVADDVGGSHGRSVQLHPRAWTLTVTSAHDGEVEL